MSKQPFMEQYFNFLNRLSVRTVRSAAYLLFFIIATIDLGTGYELHVYTVYTLPVSLVAMKLKPREAYFFVLLSVITWTATDYASGYQFSSLQYELWNNFIRACIFFLLTFGIVNVKRYIIQAKEYTEVLRGNNENLKVMNEELISQREELAEKNLQLEAASQAKTEFLANMSHELRTPLNSVIGFCEVLLDQLCGQMNDKQQKYVGIIQSSGNHLLSLINDILDLSKVETGKMELALTTFPLRETLDDSLRMLRERALKGEISLHLENTLESDQNIVADQRKLKQILYNLLSNAVKFTSKGGSVHVRVRSLTNYGGELKNQPSSFTPHPSSDYMEISVTDTGIGIREEDIVKLFQPFSQLHQVYTKGYEGTGLGLSLSKKLVELHGGWIWVESKYGVGSTFGFTIPFAIMKGTA